MGIKSILGIGIYRICTFYFNCFDDEKGQHCYYGTINDMNMFYVSLLSLAIIVATNNGIHKAVDPKIHQLGIQFYIFSFC